MDMRDPSFFMWPRPATVSGHEQSSPAPPARRSRAGRGAARAPVGPLRRTAADHDRSGAFPRENFRVLHELGLIGFVAPGPYGGGEASLADARRVIAAVAYGEPASALILTMTYLQHHAIARADSRWPRAAARACRARCDRARRTHQRPARGTRAGFAGARRTACDHGAARRRRLEAERPQALHDGHRRPRLAGGLGTHRRRGRAAGRRVPGAARRARRARDRQLGPSGPAGLGQPRSGLRGRADPPRPCVDLRPPAEWAPDAGSQTDIDSHAMQQAWMVVLLAACTTRWRAPRATGWSAS